MQNSEEKEGLKLFICFGEFLYCANNLSECIRIIRDDIKKKTKHLDYCLDESQDTIHESEINEVGETGNIMIIDDGDNGTQIYDTSLFAKGWTGLSIV